MKKLQAAMRDAAAAGWRERKLYYKVGSVFKGCMNCGVTDDEDGKKKRYLSGTQVFRSYCPKHMGWTYKCWECSATDEACWENAIDVGLEPILGNRDVVREKKKELRKRFEGDAAGPQRLPSRAEEISDLRKQIAELERRLGISQ